MSSPLRFRAFQLSLALLLAVCVAVIGIAYFTPLHRHDRVSMRQCAFTQFEHGGCFEPAVVIVVAPPVSTLCHPIAEPGADNTPSADTPSLTERGPPSVLS